MLSTDVLTTVRTVCYAIAGLICAAFATVTLFGLTPMWLPAWLPIASGVAAAVVFTLTAVLAGDRNTAASLDESYHADRRTAGNLGFWTAIVTGVVLWQARLGGEMQLAITLTLASAVYLLTHVVLEMRGR